MKIEGMVQYKVPAPDPVDGPVRRAAAPASMSRRMGPTEVIYTLLDRLYCLNFVVYAEVEGLMTLANLDRALHAVQREQPLLRTRITQLRGHPHFRAEPLEQIPLSAQARPLRHWRREVTAQLDAPFQNEAPLARFFWFSDGGGKAVAAMVFHHAIADGKSGAQVLMDVLRRAGGEALALRFQAAHPCAQTLDPAHQQGWLGGAVKKLNFWLGQGKAALKLASQLPGYDMAWRAQRDIRAVAFSLPPKTAQALRAACRKQGTTVQGALGAAQLLAINQEFETPAARHLALTSLADLRPLLHPPLGSQDLGLYIATITTVHGVNAAPDFWPLALDLKHQLTQALDSGEANLIHSFYRQNRLLPTHRLSAGLIQSTAALAPPSSMLTNIGNLDTLTLANGARIRTIAFMVSPPPQHPICVTVASYGGRMNLNLLYDQRKLTSVQAQRLARAIKAQLETAAQAPL